MLTTGRKYVVFLACLSAAFLTLLTPVAFLRHTGCHGICSAPPGVELQTRSAVDNANGERAYGRQQSHADGVHDPANCILCQALLQYMSGVTLGQARDASISVNAAPHVPGVAAFSPRKDRRAPFSSRAPPSQLVSISA